MDTQLLMKTAVLAGELMLRSGAETYRVENTMYLMLNTAKKIELAEVFVIMTGITATLKVEGENSISVVKRVNDRTTNMNRILAINNISRCYCSGEMKLEEAYAALQKMEERVYTNLENRLAIIGICVGFSMFFGGNLSDVIATLVVGLILSVCMAFGEKLKFPSFLQNVSGAFGVAVFTIVLGEIWNILNMDVVMISSIMPLVPGVAITNAVRDSLQGDYISGCARILEAFLTAAAIAIGIGLGIIIMGHISF